MTFVPLARYSCNLMKPCTTRSRSTSSTASAHFSFGRLSEPFDSVSKLKELLCLLFFCNQSSVISYLFFCSIMTTTIRQRHAMSLSNMPSSRGILFVAVLVLCTMTTCTRAYTINAPRNTRPFQTTRLMGEHTKKESSHEETYALRRPPKKRSSASKVRMTSSLVDHHVTTSPTFERRMRNVLIRDEQKRKRLNTSRGPANVKLVTSIEDYKKVVGEEREKIVVARFYAPWCKVCA
jgi:hypothetical protein